MDLATPEAFRADPGLVWQFYSARRHAALGVAPNPAHHALAAAASAHPAFLTATQNVDGLSTRAKHPEDKLLQLHGSLFTVKCASPTLGMAEQCDYVEEGNFADPIVPALRVDRDEAEKVAEEELPVCPQCKRAVLRPGVVWFGEELPEDVLGRLAGFVGASMRSMTTDGRGWKKAGDEGVDLCLVIGTSATVYPAAGYAAQVRKSGGKVAVVDLDCKGRDNGADWVFEGDAAVLVPQLLEPLLKKDG